MLGPGVGGRGEDRDEDEIYQEKRVEKKKILVKYQDDGEDC